MTATQPTEASPELQEALASLEIARWVDHAWARWLLTMAPDLFTLGSGKIEFAEYHQAWWQWVWAVPRTGRPRPFLSCWPRDTGKSMSMEVGACALGLMGVRRYFLYVSGTQAQADDHVTSIATFLERPEVAYYYPEHARRKVGKYEQVRGWRVNRLWTAGGLIIDAVGLNEAKRGARLEKERPDGLFADDIDARHESPRITQKKSQKLREDLLPALNRERAAVAFGQNLIHERSVMSDLMSGRADFLVDAIRSGPHVAVEGLQYERRTEPDENGDEVTRFEVTGGKPTWAGFTFERLSEMMTTDGERSFLRERQQILDNSGALWTSDMLTAARWNGEVPEAHRAGVAIDPKTAMKGTGAESGIVGGISAYLGRQLHAFVLHDRSGDYTPKEWAQAALQLGQQIGANWIIGERNNGGELVRTNILAEDPDANVDTVWASKNKYARADDIVPFYERGLVHHVGVFPDLEAQMLTPYDPGDTSLLWDRMDALVWLIFRLLLKQDERHYYDRSTHRR